MVSAASRLGVKEHITICDYILKSKPCKLLDALIEKIKSIAASIYHFFFPEVSKSIPKSLALQTDLQIRKLLVQPPEKHAEVVAQCAEVHSEAHKTKGTPDEHHMRLNRAHDEISQMLFVAQHEEYTLQITPKVEHRVEEPAGGLDLPVVQPSRPVTRQELQATVDAIVEKIKKRIADVGAEHKKYNVQNADQAVAMATAKEMGIALITPNGTLNKGIISSLVRILPEVPSEDYQKDIVRVLNSLDKSSKLEAILDTIVKPDSNAYQVKNIIRSVLGLSFGEEITDVHAKQTALIALLSHMRQGPVGSCFATYIEIGLLNQKLEKSLKDFAEILNTGKATRTVENEKKEFHFKLHIADEFATKKFKIDPEGNFYLQPGLNAAFKQMGIINLENKQKEVLGKLVAENVGEIDAVSLLKKFDNSELGLFAFSCETNNGLLRVWENLLAAMPEGIKGGGLNTNKIIDAVMNALKEHLKTSILVKGRPAVNPLKEAYKAELLKRINLVYDDAIGEEGGYEMENVTNPAEFKVLLINALNEVNKNNPESPFATTVDKIKTVISEDPNFLKTLLWSFDDGNKKLEDPVKDIDKCNTPWRFEGGNSLRNTFAVEMEQAIPSPVLAHPKNALELAVSFLNLCLKLKATTNIYTDEEPDEMVPMETPTHAFNALVESDKTKAFLQSGQKADDWLKHTLIEPSTLALHGQIDLALRNKAYQFMLNPSNNLIPGNKIQEFNSKIARLQNILLMETFTKKMMEILIEINAPNPERKNELWEILAAYFLSEGLSEKTRQQLDNAALPIADLSWTKDNSDLNFKVIFDVITMKPILVGINSSRTSYKVVNQREWVNVLIKYFPTNY